jgi:DNA-binding CsgD family transcriptional regulator
MDEFRGADGRAGLDLIGEIYDTGTELHQWGNLLDSISRFVGATSGIMGVTDMATSQSAPDLYIHGLDDTLMRRWNDEFALQDVWAEAGYAPGVGEICTGAELRSVDETRRLPIYSAVHEPLGIGDCLVTALQNTDHRVMYFSLYRPAGHGLFSSEEVDRLRPLAPHLVRAAHLQNVIERAALRERASRSALDELGFGVFALEAGRAEPLNQAAEEILERGSGLRSVGGRLSARDPTSNDRLQAAINAAGGGQLATPSVGSATPFQVRSDFATLALSCWAIPLEHGRRLDAIRPSSGSAALLLVADPEKGRTLAADTIARLFDLTPAESRLAAAIGSGETLKDYAVRVGLTDNTVRGSLKKVQSRLGTPRQVDLALLLSRAVPPNRA